VQNYNIKLSCKIKSNYLIQRAADSVDLDINKKLTHDLKVNIDLETDYNIGLIVGNSGSGKTTLAKKIFGENIFDNKINPNKSIINQFENLDYKDIVRLLTGIGLNSVPCWIKPFKYLSNGQKARAEAAYLMQNFDNPIIDEWTSVVDRTIGKVMSHCVNKYSRKNDKKIILLSCHYDIIDWLNPDWILDLNNNEYIDRRNLVKNFKKKTASNLKSEKQAENLGNHLANITI
jgi:ABC-type ATPase with predicted acetyltransferase domain